MFQTPEVLPIDCFHFKRKEIIMDLNKICNFSISMGNLPYADWIPTYAGIQRKGNLLIYPNLLKTYQNVI